MLFVILLSLLVCKNLLFLLLLLFLWLSWLVIYLSYLNLDFYASFLLYLELTTILVFIVYIYYVSEDYKHVSILNWKFTNISKIVTILFSYLFLVFYLSKNYSYLFLLDNNNIDFFSTIYKENKSDFYILYNAFYCINFKLLIILFYFIFFISYILIISFFYFKFNNIKKKKNKLQNFQRHQQFFKQSKNLTSVRFFKK